MDHFHLMQVFVAVAEQGSFASAARLLGISPAAVTRAIMSLERYLSVQLVERSTRNVRLTEVGRCHAERCRPILDSVRFANEAVLEANEEFLGSLTVTAPTIFGKSLVMPCILAYMNRYPRVNVSAFFKDRLVNLLDEGIDVAVRIGNLPDSGLKALRVGYTRKVLCASPAYLSQHGTPKSPSDLRHHAVIASNNISPRAEWKLDTVGVSLIPRLVAASNEVAAIAAEGGIGIAQFHYYQVVDQITNGRLIVVLPEIEAPSTPIHIVHRETTYSSTKVRTFIDMLAIHLKGHPGVA